MTRLRSFLVVWAGRLKTLTFEDAARLLPAATASAAALSIGLVASKSWRTPHFPYSFVVAQWALSAFVASLTLRMVLDRLARSRPTWINKEAITPWLIALELGVVLLIVPVFLLVKSVAEEDMTGWNFPIVNKRWLLALYNLAIATVVILPAAIARWRSEPADVPSPPDLSPGRASRRRWLGAMAGQFAVVGVCWYLAGPPWHLEDYHRGIEWHEQMHFGALQAIAKGYLPSVGPAATSYGAGSQMLVAEVMKRLGGFNLVSFRVAWLTQHFLAMFIVGTVAYWWLGFLPAVAVMFLASLYSPLAFFYTLVNGTMAGFFGWANPLRYIAPLVVVPILGAVALGNSGKWAVVLAGGAWSLGAWMAQENLTTTAASTALFLTLLCLTQTVSLSRIAWLLGYLAAGFAGMTIPILAYYARHGVTASFIHSYFFFARAIAVGYSNMWWPANESATPARYSYYFTFPLLIAAAICTVWRLPALRLMGPLGTRRTLFLAFICVQLVCYQTSLLRSDSTHVMNTMIALPFILVLGFLDLPGWITSTPVSRWLVRAVLVVLILTVYPTLTQVNWRTVSDPARRFQAGARVPVERSELEDPRSRVRPLLPSEPMFLGEPISVGEFMELVAELHEIVGHRKTYLLSSDHITGGLIAFAADLTPAPHPPGGDILTINDEVRAQVADHIRSHPRDYGAFIGPSLDQPEPRAFLESHPGTVQLERKLGDTSFHILLSPE